MFTYEFCIRSMMDICKAVIIYLTYGLGCAQEYIRLLIASKVFHVRLEGKAALAGLKITAISLCRGPMSSNLLKGYISYGAYITHLAACVTFRVLFENFNHY